MKCKNSTVYDFWLIKNNLKFVSLLNSFLTLYTFLVR